MKHYIIDGNNLMGKIESLRKIQSRDGQSAREKLAFMIDTYFHDKQVKVTLHFDGFMHSVIKTNRSKIEYSNKRPADDLIKRQIENINNPRNIVLVSSDSNLLEFARVCRCDTLTSEHFAHELSRTGHKDSEEEKAKGISNDEIKKLFGL